MIPVFWYGISAPISDTCIMDISLNGFISVPVSVRLDRIMNYLLFFGKCIRLRNCFHATAVYNRRNSFRFIAA